MEYEGMIRERIDSWERERADAHLYAEAKRLGIVQAAGPRDWLDSWLIKAGRGAERRQATRIGTNREPVL